MLSRGVLLLNFSHILSLLSLVVQPTTLKSNSKVNIHRVQKRPPFIFWITLSKVKTAFNAFWHVKSWGNLRRQTYRLSTSPVRCSHCTSRNPKVISSIHIHTYTSDCLRCLTRKQYVIHLPTPPENVTRLTCELQNFFIWLKVCCVLLDIGGSEKSQLSCGLSSVALKRTVCDVWQFFSIKGGVAAPESLSGLSGLQSLSPIKTDSRCVVIW